MVNATRFWFDHDSNQNNVELTIGTVIQPLITRGGRAGSVLPEGGLGPGRPAVDRAPPGGDQALPGR
jgi:hypothetical protein